MIAASPLILAIIILLAASLLASVGGEDGGI